MTDRMRHLPCGQAVNSNRVFTKDLSRINLYILLVWFSDLFVRKPRRTCSFFLQFQTKNRGPVQSLLEKRLHPEALPVRHHGHGSVPVRAKNIAALPFKAREQLRMGMAVGIALAA